MKYLIALAIIGLSAIGWRVGSYIAKQQINRQKLAQVKNKV
jgi:hypothetical protein